jgi:hypothetical protein
MPGPLLLVYFMVGRICMRSFAKILRAACVARKIDQDVL